MISSVKGPPYMSKGIGGFVGPSSCFLSHSVVIDEKSVD